MFATFKSDQETNIFRFLHTLQEGLKRVQAKPYHHRHHRMISWQCINAQHTIRYTLDIPNHIHHNLVAMSMAINETTFTTTPNAFITAAATTNLIPDNLPIIIILEVFQTLVYTEVARIAPVTVMEAAIIHSDMGVWVHIAGIIVMYTSQIIPVHPVEIKDRTMWYIHWY